MPSHPGGPDSRTLPPLLLPAVSSPCPRHLPAFARSCDPLYRLAAHPPPPSSRPPLGRDLAAPLLPDFPPGETTASSFAADIQTSTITRTRSTVAERSPTGDRAPAAFFLRLPSPTRLGLPPFAAGPSLRASARPAKGETVGSFAVHRAPTQPHTSGRRATACGAGDLGQLDREAVLAPAGHASPARPPRPRPMAGRCRAADRRRRALESDGSRVADTSRSFGEARPTI